LAQKGRNLTIFQKLFPNLFCRKVYTLLHFYYYGNMSELCLESDRSTVSEPYFKWVAECLYRHSRTGTYYALVKRDGRQVRKSLKTPDRQLAERRLADFRRKVNGLGNPARDRGVTFMELADEWLAATRTRLKSSSAKRLEVSIRQLKKQFGIIVVRNLNTLDCHRWLKSRGGGISASAFNQERSTLVAILEFAVEEGLLLNNPAIKIGRRKMPKGNVIIPSREQFSQLVNTIRAGSSLCSPGADLVELLAYSGMRLGEAIALTWGPHGIRHTAITEACKVAAANGIGLEEVLDFSRHSRSSVAILMIYRDRERNIQGQLASCIAAEASLNTTSPPQAA